MSKRHSSSQKRANQRRTRRVERTQKKKKSQKVGTTTTAPLVSKTKRKRLKEVSDRLQSRRSKLTQWYLGLPMIKKVLLGLIIIPIIVALILLQGVILPFLAGLFGIVLAISKSAFILVKGGAFIVYISYKIFKGLLGIYLCVSRSINGLKAHRLRAQQARLTPNSNAQYPALCYQTTDHEDSELSIHAGFKKLTFETQSDLKHTIIFSYLRYFIIGQIFMYLSFWKDKVAYLTLWRRNSRDQVKDIFKEIGKTIFSPHLLGPHLTAKRILVPGDAKLISLNLNRASQQAVYTFEMHWRERKFKRQYPFFESHKYQSIWTISLPTKLNSLSADEFGYHSEMCGEASHTIG